MKKLDYSQIHLEPIEVQVLWLCIGTNDLRGNKLSESWRSVELKGLSYPRRQAAEELVRKGILNRYGNMPLHYAWSGDYGDLAALRKAYPLKSIKD